MSYHCDISAIRPDLVRGSSSPASMWLVGQLNDIKRDLYYPHRFRSLAEFWSHYELPARKGNWRLTDYQLGHFISIVRSYGRLAATNGLYAYVVRTDDSLVEGMLMNFRADEYEDAVAAMFARVRAKKAKPLAKLMVNF